MNTDPLSIFDNEDRALGCPWCGGKSVTETSTGKVFWYPSIGCCPTSAALQFVWRSKDVEVARERYEAHQAAGRNVSPEHLTDAEEELRIAMGNFDWHIPDATVLDAAMREAAKTGHDPFWQPARLRVRRHRPTGAQPSPDQFEREVGR